MTSSHRPALPLTDWLDQAEARLLDALDLLTDQGWVAFEQLIPPEVIAALFAEQAQEFAAGNGIAAGIGQGDELREEPKVRQDQIIWFIPEQLSQSQAPFSAMMTRFQILLNRHCFLGIVEFESHYASYPPGAFYKRHLDQFQQSSRRLLSGVLYLNEDWLATDGGQLRLFVPKDGGETQRDILPVSGTFLLFRSEAIEHEVLPTLRSRASIATWFKVRPLDRPLL